jgi:DNA helicase HerA-like ATPase
MQDSPKPVGAESTYHVDDSVQLPVTWQIGQHIAAVGDTGTGKTYLVSKLTELRQYVVIFRTKPDDIKFPGFRKARTVAALDDLYETRILLEPKHGQQMRQGYELLTRVWDQGGWTVVIDEEWYVEARLHLTEYVETLLTQGRSKKISVIVGMQRPSRISRFAISQCTHLFSFRVEGRDLQTIKEATTPRIVEPISSLTGHDFVYYNRARRIVVKGNARALDRILIGGSQARNGGK